MNSVPLEESMQSFNTASNFQFSGAGMDQLADGATEYTLAIIALDISWSVNRFARDLEKMLKTIVEACQKSPRSNNLLLRIVTFNSKVDEMHGFRQLSEIDPTEYDNSLNCEGCTTCFDAVVQAIESASEYAKALQDQSYLSNAVLYVLTDGDDNNSKGTAGSVKKAKEKAAQDEYLESLGVVLIGVGYDDLSQYLDDFKRDADLTQFISMTDLFNKTSPAGALAKLAGLISHSISSTSQALASGSSTATSAKLSF